MKNFKNEQIILDMKPREFKIEQKYIDIFDYVKKVYAEFDNHELITTAFMTRLESIWETFLWTTILCENNKRINKDALFTAALFCDAGRFVPGEAISYAEQSEKIFREYYFKYNIKELDADFVSYLIKNHDNEELMTNRKTVMELLLLIQARMKVQSWGYTSLALYYEIDNKKNCVLFEKIRKYVNITKDFFRNSPNCT